MYANCPCPRSFPSHCLCKIPSLENISYNSNANQKCRSVSCQEKDNPSFSSSFSLLPYISSNQYFKNLSVIIHSLIFFLVEKQIELGVGFSKVLTAIAKLWNKLSECFSTEKCFFTGFIAPTLQSFLFTDGYSQELIFATSKHILQDYWQDFPSALKSAQLLLISFQILLRPHPHHTLFPPPHTMH